MLARNATIRSESETPLKRRTICGNPLSGSVYTLGGSNKTGPQTKQGAVLRESVQNCVRWLREWVTPLLSVVMALFSVTMACVTVTRSRDTGQLLKAVSDKTLLISENLTTQFIGEFPTFIPELANILNSADKTEPITIVCDFPGYGIYSDHDGFLKYRQALESKAMNSDIAVVVLSAAQQRQVSAVQFDGDTFETIKGSQNYANFLKWAHHSDADFKTKDDFLIALAQEHSQVWSTDFRSVKERYEYSSTMPMFVWIVGKRVAVFSVPNVLLKQGGLEAAFRTSDKRLIEQLQMVAESYQKASTLVGH